MNAHPLPRTVHYPERMHPLDPALEALTRLRSGAAAPGSAQDALRLARLEAAIRQEQVTPRDADQLLRAALALRGAHPTAADPGWRVVICTLAGYALREGVPAPSVIQAIRADQLVADMRREPRLHGEALVIMQDGQLRLHPDIPQVLPETRRLN